jgi:methionyl-tRNA synthetase
MNMEDKKISGSQNWGVWGLDFLSRYDPESLRFYLTINMPETRDSNWDWDDFVARNNNQLVATWGNLANRVLSFAHKNWDGYIPVPGEITDLDKEIISTVQAGFDSVGSLIEDVKLRAALIEAIRIASEVNKYLDTAAPWSAIKEDKEAAGTIIYTAMQCIDYLKLIFAPFLPQSSSKLHEYLGYDYPLFGELSQKEIKDELSDHIVQQYQPTELGNIWKAAKLEPGKEFSKPSPLFTKYDPKIADEERERMA